jgi:hypothetical protein
VLYEQQRWHNWHPKSGHEIRQLPLDNNNIKKRYEFHFGSKVGIQDKSWAPHICCVTCEASYRIGKWFTPNAVHHSHGLERIKRPLIQLLPLFNKHNRDRLQIRTHSEIYRFGTCNEAYPTQWRVFCTKSLQNLTFSVDNSDPDEDHIQQQWDNVDCDPTSEASSSLPEPTLQTQGDLNDLACDLNLSLKKAKLFGSRLNCGTSPLSYWNMCLSQTPKWI